MAERTREAAQDALPGETKLDGKASELVRFREDPARRGLREAFLRGYRGAAAALQPKEPTAQALLEAMELEKLLYELRYEVGHRPDWVRIPMVWIRKLVDDLHSSS